MFAVDRVNLPLRGGLGEERTKKKLAEPEIKKEKYMKENCTMCVIVTVPVYNCSVNVPPLALLFYKSDFFMFFKY